MSDCKSEQDQWFWTKSQRRAMILVFLRSKITKIDDVGEPPVPSQPKTMSETKYLDSKASQEKVCNFVKKYFSQYFATFSTPQNPKFRDLTDLAMCPSLTCLMLTVFFF